MDAQIVWTVVCGLAIVVGAVGIIVPVLPGSLLIGVSLLVWALVLGSPLGWIIFGIAALFIAAGMTSSAVLTGRAMKATGLGILAEFGFASLAAGTWGVGVLIHFVSR